MASIVIPTIDSPFYSIRTTLDGADYTLNFRYNTREQRWYMDIYDSEEVALLLGIKILCQSPIARFQQDSYGLFPGLMFAISGTTDQSPPLYGELGPNKRVQLVYYPEDPSTAN